MPFVVLPILDLGSMYNSGTMMPGKSAGPSEVELRLLDPLELFQICAADRENSNAWSEFLRRYTNKIKYFIQGTLRQVLGYTALQNNSTATGCIQESDLFQNAIVRLVENDCAAMKRFSGKSENDLLCYLAVICRSSVLDTLRRNSALKRRPTAAEKDEFTMVSAGSLRQTNHFEFERKILLHEIVSLTQHTIQSHSGDVSTRDQLVFNLHFFDGLSYGQIAQCKGVNLSKAGVEKLLKRLLDRVQTLASSGKTEGMRQ
jgi:RNA polymerase sigma factor (sigma-70 family)